MSYPVEGGISSKRHISWPCSPPWSPSCRRSAARSLSSAECASASSRPSIGCQQTEMDSLNNFFFIILSFENYFLFVTNSILPLQEAWKTNAFCQIIVVFFCFFFVFFCTENMTHFFENVNFRKKMIALDCPVIITTC